MIYVTAWGHTIVGHVEMIWNHQEPWWYLFSILNSCLDPQSCCGIKWLYYLRFMLSPKAMWISLVCCHWKPNWCLWSMLLTKCQVDVSDLFNHHRSCDISVYVTSLACLSPWLYCNTDEDITKDHANLCGLYHHLKPWWCTWSMLLHEFMGWTPTVDHIDCL